jgi:hypothetical protein
MRQSYSIYYLKKFRYHFEADSIRDAERRAKNFQSAHPAGHVILLGIYLDTDPPPTAEIKASA